MHKYLNLIMVLISGLTLTFLNNQLVSKTITEVSTFYDPTDIHSIFFKIGVWISRGIGILSFLGIFISIVCTILILIKALTNR